MSVETSVEFGVCPVANICSVTAGEGPACGTVPEHLMPLGFAEELCQRALQGYFMQERNAPVGDYSMAARKRTARLSWTELELAMLPKMNEEAAKNHFDTAEDYADTLLDATDVTWQLKMDAALLKTYLPAFKARREGTNLSGEQIHTIRQSIGVIYESLLKAPVHPIKRNEEHLDQPGHIPCLKAEDERSGMTMKMAAYMLAARAGILLYPGSYREAHLGGRDNIRDHHDAYIVDGDKKLPVKARLDPQSENGGKDRIRYGKSLLYLPIRAIANTAISNLKLSHPRFGTQYEIPLEFAWWLHSEAQGYTLPGPLPKILDAASEIFLDKLNEFRAQFYELDQKLPSLVTFDPQKLGPIDTFLRSNTTAQESSVPEETPEETLSSDALDELKIEEVEWTILPAGGDEDLQPGKSEPIESTNVRTVSYERIAKLRQLAYEWGNDSYLAVANMDKTGDFDYCVAVLPEVINGIRVEHAVAENPGSGNAIYVFRGEKGVVDQTVILGWKDVFRASKKEAKQLGARRILHTLNAETNLLEYLTRPNTHLFANTTSL